MIESRYSDFNKPLAALVICCEHTLARISIRMRITNTQRELTVKAMQKTQYTSLNYNQR